MKTVNRLLTLVLLTLLTSGCESSGITWHSYVHPSGQIHYVLRLADYKRGLFFGSCGPSTYSLQWEYRIELTGAGPRYPGGTIELQDGNFHHIPVDSGTIVVDENRKSANVDISVIENSKVQPFAHNGTYKMEKET